MPEKKTIKIKTDSNKTNDREFEPESNTPDEQIIKGDDDPIKELEAKLKAKEKEAGETYDRLLRASAEFDNYKKRSSREME
jgi:molecular chaperone GrpE